MKSCRLLTPGVCLVGLSIGLFFTFQGTSLQAQSTTGGPFKSGKVTPYKTKLDPNQKRPPTKKRPEGFSTEPPVISPAVRPVHPAPPNVQLGQKSIQFRAAGIDDLSDPLVNVPGLTGGGPPDTVGDVGPNHYIQMINSTPVRIIDKQGNTTAMGQLNNLSDLWPATDPCGQSDVGDPIVVYDHLADRWLLSQFEAQFDAMNNPIAPFHMCIAISQTPDPTQPTWYAYTFDVPSFPDYPKFGVWPDGYYMTSFEGGNLGAFVFDRSAMLSGAAAGLIKYTIPSLGSGNFRSTRLLPSDLDGPAPANGTPNYFVRTVDNNQDGGGGPDRIEVWEFAVNWPAGTSSFGPAATQTLTAGDGLFAFDTMTCDRNSTGATNAFRDCVPVPGGGTADALSNRPMMQLKYRIVDGTPNMVFNQTIDVQGAVATIPGLTVTAEVAGIRWYQLQRPGGSWIIGDQGTFAAQPIGVDDEGDVLHRWMGSMAIDKKGNVAVGYSISSDDTVHPGMQYTGRLAGDLPGTFTQGEKVIFTGTTSPGGTGTRWGDYSALSVDPVDNCTFWFTTHAAGSVTQIASFHFANCNPVDLVISKSDSPDPVIAGNILTYTITVVNNGDETATNVVATDTLPAGVDFLSSSIPCSGAGQTKTCNLGTLNAGASQQFTIQVRVPADYLSSIPASIANLTNTASVTATEADSNPVNNSTSETTQVIERADLRLTKTCKPDGPAPAGSLTGNFCDLIVANLGASDAQNVTVVDDLVSNAPFTILSYSVTPSGTCAPPAPVGPVTSQTVTCSLGTIAAGASTTIRVNITADQAADVNDTASVSSSTPDPNLDNNSASGKIVFVSSANLGITKTAAPNPVVAGENLTYTLTVTNAGASAAQNVVVKDTIPGQTSVVSVTPGGGFQCQGGIPGNPAQPLTCGLGAVPFPAGASANIVVVVKVAPSVPNGTILVNNASVGSDTPDPDNSNNLVTANAPVVARADLAIVKTSDKDVYKPSTQVIYTVTVTNNGSSDAQAVVVTDTLPDPKQALYQSNNGGCTLIAGKTLDCQLGAMPIGTSKSFQIYMVVKGSRGLVSNTAAVTSSTVDPIAGNNSSTRNVIVGK